MAVLITTAKQLRAVTETINQSIKTLFEHTDKQQQKKHFKLQQIRRCDVSTEQ